MKITESKLRSIIRKTIVEYGPLHGGHEGRGVDLEKSSPERNKGYGWMEFICYAEEGDYDSAGEWIQGLASDYGITLDTEVEHSFIEMASADATAKECQDAWNEYLEMLSLIHISEPTRP